MNAPYSLADSIIITGPTTTGKSRVAVELAKKLNGAIINTDDYYFFAENDFHIGLGLALDEPPQEVPHFLYGALAVGQSKPEAKLFLHLIEKAANNAIEHGYRPVFEGCSFYLNKELVNMIPTENVFAITLNREGLDKRIDNRIKEMCQEGLINETDQIVKANLHRSWIVENGVIYNPTVKFCLGLIDEDTMVAKIAEGIKMIAIQQEEKYKSIPQIRWISPEQTPSQTAKQIINKLGQSL